MRPVGRQGTERNRGANSATSRGPATLTPGLVEEPHGDKQPVSERPTPAPSRGARDGTPKDSVYDKKETRTIILSREEDLTEEPHGAKQPATERPAPAPSRGARDGTPRDSVYDEKETRTINSSREEDLTEKPHGDKQQVSKRPTPTPSRGVRDGPQGTRFIMESRQSSERDRGLGNPMLGREPLDT